MSWHLAVMLMSVPKCLKPATIIPRHTPLSFHGINFVFFFSRVLIGVKLKLKTYLSRVVDGGACESKSPKINGR